MTGNEKVPLGMPPSPVANSVEGNLASPTTVSISEASGSLPLTGTTQFSVVRAWCWLLVGLSVTAVAGHLLRIVEQRVEVAPGRIERVEYIVDVNTAPQHELEALPNVGAALASRIVHYRQTQGPFDQLEELQQVRGVGARTLEQLRPRLSLSLPTEPALSLP